MSGIDTNILLRFWLNDDPLQSRRIDQLLAEHRGLPGSLLVTDVVLVEAVWALKSADCLVVAKHARKGCDFSATFDRGIRKLPGVKLL